MIEDSEEWYDNPEIEGLAVENEELKQENERLKKLIKDFGSVCELALDGTVSHQVAVKSIYELVKRESDND